MAKKVETPVENLVRFTAGAAEIAAADRLRDAAGAEGSAFLSFYTQVIARHSIPLTALVTQAKGERRSNEAQAAYDFTRRMYWIATFGVAIADLIADANVKGDAVLPLSSVIGRNGLPYKDQSKRAVAQSFGGTPWKEFVSRLCEIEGSDGEDVKREKASQKTDKEFVIDRVTALVKRLAKPAEKLDGSIAFDIAPKLGKGLIDLLAAYGIK